MNALGKVLYGVGDLLAKAMYLHFLWVVFTLAGLIIFGVMPATVSVFTVIRKWLMKENDVSIFGTFLDSYKSYFVETNLIGLFYFLIGLFLYFDLHILNTELDVTILRVFTSVAGFLYILMGLFLLPVYVHLNLSKLNYMKQSLLMVFARPFEALFMLISLVVLYYLFLYLPVLLFFTGSTIAAFPVMWIGMRTFNKIQMKQTAYLQSGTNMNKSMDSTFN
ncbi:YesL family protein [Neobacillus kokaensis]|uniref:DUF624 domain-containing protein n=1 Tax=Neobacillus kokaensis TaxID=2759023 RepID=A0ABQ3N2Y4_9BACI|nr:DUF624 domain-containing protein [Neobacillus kokaensis]GHH97878.1 hypothetical protein AM1BK_14210 [Neobacillus kokaensis]